MSEIQPAVSYTPVAKLFHWGMALVWIAAWGIGFTAAHGGKSLNPEHVLTFLHKAIASTILFLTVLRLLWRFGHRPPILPETMSALSQQFAHFGHLLLYAVALIALPISGWLSSSFAGKPILMAGFIPLPPLAAPDKALGATVFAIHTYTAWFCGLLVLGHILIAIKHHVIDRDDILLRMKWR